MSKIDNTTLIKHLQSKWGDKSCPMCDSGPWSVQDSTFQLMEFNDGGFVVGGPIIPVVPVVCTNCGHTILVNAIIAGVMKPPVDPTNGGI